ncbi:MAG TPA: sugar phosphate isomerase/epimerase family protein [Jiangellaceae bacterium]|nr:sugar phosphate isomerase/epimerase family protein [Jiangellaceae bacterium]
MELGFLTSSLGAMDLRSIAAWAGSNGFAALEVGAWPLDDPRTLNPGHLDVRHMDARRARELREQFDEAGVDVSALAYYDNNLHRDRATRAAVHDHLRACIDAAALLGVPAVGTFIGRDVGETVATNLAEAERVFPPIVAHAETQGIVLVVENCPMSGWHPDGYPANLAYSPELWEWMAGLGLRLNYDPSHLVGLGIDPLRALRAHLPLVAHVQAKDVEVLDHRIDRFGFIGNAVDRSNPWDHAWWRYRVPGHGQVDWAGVIGELREGGYDGIVSVEHEDPYLSGSVPEVKRGLLAARAALEPLLHTLVEESSA